MGRAGLSYIIIPYSRFLCLRVTFFSNSIKERLTIKHFRLDLGTCRNRSRAYVCNSSKQPCPFPLSPVFQSIFEGSIQSSNAYKLGNQVEIPGLKLFRWLRDSGSRMKSLCMYEIILVSLIFSVQDYFHFGAWLKTSFPKKNLQVKSRSISSYPHPHWSLFSTFRHPLILCSWTILQTSYELQGNQSNDKRKEADKFYIVRF